MTQHGIKEGEQGIDPIQWWPARPAIEAQGNVILTDKMIENVKISARGIPFYAAQCLDVGHGQRAAGAERELAFDLRHSVVGDRVHRLTMIAQCPHDDGALIGDLGGDDAADDRHRQFRRISNPILCTTKQDIPATFALHPRLKSTVGRQKGQGDAGFGAGGHECR